MSLTLEEQLKRKYADIKKMNDEIPAQLARKIKLQSEAHLLIGKMHAAAAYEYGKAYAKRKQVWGMTIVESEGTMAMREGAAEVAAAPFREAEALAESEMIAWKNAFASTAEIINAMKMELRVLMGEMGGGMSA